MKKTTNLLLIACLAIFSLQVSAQSTINITTSGGSFPNEKWVSITTMPDGTGMQVFGQGNGTQCDDSGLIIQNIDLAPGIYYVNCYDQYDDSWDGTLISVTAYGDVIGNNEGVTPDDNEDTDQSNNCDGTPEELEASFQIIVPNPPTCLQPSSAVINSMTDISAEASWDAGIVTAEYEWLVVASGDGSTGIAIDNGSTAALNTNITGLNAETPYDFFIKADCEIEYVGPVSFTTNATPPQNNTCATAIDLSLETSPLSASITNVTTANESLSCGLTAGRDLFYQILVPNTFEFSFNQTVNTFDSVHRVAYSSSCPGETELSCIDGGTGNGEYAVTEWTNDTGVDQTIYIVIEGYNNSSLGDFTFQWSVNAPPTCLSPTELTTSVISATSVDLSWIANTGENSWDIKFGLPGFDPLTEGTLVQDNDGISTTQVNGLNPATEYEVYVRAVCSPTDMSVYSEASLFTTNCGAFNVPFNENFDTTTTGGTTSPNAPNCWSFINTGAGWTYVINSSFNSQSGNKSYRFNNNNDITGDYLLISPEIVELTTDGVQVSFSAKGLSGQELEVGTISDPSDASTFTVLNTVTLSSSSYEDIELNIVAGIDSYFAVRHGQTGTNDTYYLDDFTFNILPSCLEPSALMVTNVTTSNATVSWTAGATETDWEYVLQTADTGIPTESGTPLSGTPSVNFMSLTENTAYEVYVRAICGIDTSEYSDPILFYTGYCTSIPTSVDNNGIAEVIIDSTTFTSAGDDVTYEDFTGVPVDIQQAVLTNLQITFQTGFTYDTNVWIDLNDNLIFEASEKFFDGVSSGANPTTLDASFILPVSAPLGIHRMRIGTADSGQNTPNPCYNGTYGVTIDLDVTVTEAPSCLQPSNIIIDSITDITAEASWSEGIVTTEYQWVVVANGDLPTDTAVDNGNVATLNASITGLIAEMSYDFYVKADCETDFVGPTTFTTNSTPPANDTCDSPTTIIASTNFECENQLSGTTNAATISNLDGCSFSGKDVWYSFTPATTSQYSVVVSETNDTGFNSTYVTIYTGMCGNLTQIGTSCSSTSYNGTLNQDIPYLINVRSTSTTASYVDFNLCVVQLIAPENNDCDNPEILTASIDDTCVNKVSGTTEGATTTAPDGCSTSGKDVWYSYIPVNSGNFLFNLTETNDTGFNSTYITIYDGLCGELNQIGTSCSSTSLTATLIQDVEYLVNVRTTSTALNSFVEFDLCVREAIPPVNDNFANATDLVVGTTCSNILGTLLFATNSAESTAASCGSTDGLENDVWYSFVAPANGNIIVETSEANTVNFDTVMVFYDTDGITQLVCNDDIITGVRFSGFSYQGLTPGATYFLEVHAYNNDAPGDFNICAYSPDCTGSTVTWDGSSWTPNDPTFNDIAIINGTYNTVDDGNINACSLVINPGRILTVTAGNFININTDITVNGTLNVNHQGSIVQIDEDAVTLNNGEINVNITTPDLDPRDFMLIGSPMSEIDRTDLDGFRLLNHDTNAFEAGDLGMTVPDATNFIDADQNDWLTFTGTLNPAEGYMYWPAPDLVTGGEYDLLFNEGTLNSGTISYPTTFTGDVNDSPNMLSNPYASAIDTDLLISRNDAINEVYFWEHNTVPSDIYPNVAGVDFDMRDISVRNEGAGVASTTGGNAPTQFMSTAQGFGIKAMTNDPVIFTNDMRVTESDAVLRNSIEADRLWLNLKSNSFSDNSNLAIVFTGAATAGFDNGFDTERIATTVSMYTQISNDQGYIIQSREAFSNGASITAGFSSRIGQDESYTISLTEREGDNITGATIYLIDNLTNTITNLIQNNYTFGSESGNFPGRFTIVFENEALGISDLSLESIAIYPNPAQDKLNITSPNALLKSIQVIDIRGVVIINELVSQQNTTTIDVSNLSNAVYFVTMSTDKGSLTKRFIKK
ncbi:hypothetical protein ULMS_20780 [Patiriisocius marinistellae]|uniref:Fibronectin type-III domain-containing protein n=1 Tax=Patiriisocius marinistellae TaxID=2494560 RepID=A0A5J4FWK5_9FLAO|nr:fibronectin type III domain-containing protein [Patiriisocius marinistellae]GEQ86570.1 hypothetical protein ULMS_20780 [Patiriisocius marinistellae]